VVVVDARVLIQLSFPNKKLLQSDDCGIGVQVQYKSCT